MTQPSVLGIVLAGGAGTRLSPLTADRAKPAVPFGGLYRLIDFALSNLANGGIRKICVLTQYKSHSLDRHITTTWRMSALLGNYVTPVPAQQRLGPHWYTGSADAIYQSMNLINDEQPNIVMVVGADHVYRMDPQQMIDHHMAHGAGVTVAATSVASPGLAGSGASAITSTHSKMAHWAASETSIWMMVPFCTASSMSNKVLPGFQPSATARSQSRFLASSRSRSALKNV